MHDVKRTNEAYRQDSHGGFYPDLDLDSGAWGVFGTESGFCYATFSCEADAARYAVMMQASLAR